MSLRMHYVCDRCGHYFTHEAASMLECPREECQSPNLWQFASKERAVQHSHDIEEKGRV
jgi:DNA-directed RNA polymerase subunit RPC12/RpoP